MPKVHEVVAARDELKKATERDRTRIYHLLQKEELFNGFAQHFEPTVDDADVSTPEEKPVQYQAEALLTELLTTTRDYWDVQATAERSNISTRADIVVEEEDGSPVVLMKDAPIGFLLFMKNQLDDLITAVGKVPVLKSDVVYEAPTAQQPFYHAQAKRRSKTAMKKETLLKSEDVKNGIKQFENVDVQKTVGYLVRTELSGALPESRRKEILARLRRVLVAVNAAKQRANAVDAVPTKVADRLTAYILRGASVPASE